MVLSVILVMCFGAENFTKIINKRFFLYLISGLNIIIICFTLFASFFYSRFGWLKWVSALVTGRFEYASWFINEFPVRLFGIDITFIDKYRFASEQILDCGIISILLHFGVIVFVTSVAIYMTGIRKMWEDQKYIGMIVVSGFILYSVMENIYFNIFTNLGLILCCYYFVNRRSIYRKANVELS